MKNTTEKKDYKYALKLSSRKGTRGVIFCLYKHSEAYSHNTRKMYNTFEFVKHLSSDYNTALAIALESIRPYTINDLEIIDKKPFNKKGGSTQVFVTGRHRGKTVKDVYKIDPGYIHWIAREHPSVFDKLIPDCINACIKNKKPYKPIFEIFNFVKKDWQFVETIMPAHLKISGIYRYLHYYKKNKEFIVVHWEDNRFTYDTIQLRPTLCVPDRSGNWIKHYEALE